MFRTFTVEDADSILRSSERKSTSFNPPSDGRGRAVGHTARDHFLLSNDALMERYWNALYRENSKDFLVITAFSGQQKNELASAAKSVLNANQSQAAMTTFFGRDGEDGMRAEIHYSGTEEYQMRYVASSGYSVQVMPISCFVMVLDRHAARPFGLHIHTFFGAIPYVPRNYATIKSRNGRPLFSHPGY